LTTSSRVSITLFSVYGSEIQSIVNDQNLIPDRHVFEIKTENLIKGIYIVRLLKDGKLSDCKKVVIN